MQITTGFYYHYKHDPEGKINNYAYEVMGVGCHTEKEDGSPDKYVVVYRPLYEAYSYRNDKLFDIRPLDMFMEEVVVNGNRVPRFRIISDSDVIAVLAGVKKEMYPPAS